MRWKINKLPYNGEERIVRKFLWFPLNLAVVVPNSTPFSLCFQTRWLEYANIKQAYQGSMDGSEWFNVSWVD